MSRDDVEHKLQYNPSHNVTAQEEEKVVTVVDDDIYCKFVSKG